MEYWELEQAKLKAKNQSPNLPVKLPLSLEQPLALVSFASKLISKGSVVCALDINPSVENIFQNDLVTGFCCDVTDKSKVKEIVRKIVLKYGGMTYWLVMQDTFLIAVQ